MLNNDFNKNRIYFKKISKINYLVYYKKYYQDEFYKYVFTDKHYLKNKALYFACYKNSNNEFIGCISCYLPIQNNTLWIQSFFIDKKYIRQGYGSEFFQIISKYLSKSYNIHKICLACYALNKVGIIFWKHLGFIKIKESIKIIDGKKTKILILKKTYFESNYIY